MMAGEDTGTSRGMKRSTTVTGTPVSRMYLEGCRTEDQWTNRNSWRAARRVQGGGINRGVKMSGSMCRRRALRELLRRLSALPLQAGPSGHYLAAGRVALTVRHLGGGRSSPLDAQFGPPTKLRLMEFGMSYEDASKIHQENASTQAASRAMTLDAPPEQQGMLSQYETLVQQGILQPDSKQREVVLQLEQVRQKLADHCSSIKDFQAKKRAYLQA